MNNDSSALFKSLFLGDIQFIDHVVPFFLWVLDDVDFVGNGGSSWWLITSDHDDLDTSGSAFVHGQVNLWSWGIVQRNDTDKSQIVHWEAAFNAGVVGNSLLRIETPFFPGLGVEGIGASVVLSSI